MKYWLGLGANLGDRMATLQAAVDELSRRGVTVEAVSGVYETAPREVEDQPQFLNAVCRVECPLDPPALLTAVKGIERDLGRVAGPRYGPRAIDIDILIWDGGSWASDELDVPHPRLGERRFALVPLLDLDPELRLRGRRVADIEQELADGDDQPVARAPDRLRLPSCDA